MRMLSIQSGLCSKLTLVAFFLAAPIVQAQSSAVHTEAPAPGQHLRSRLFIYDLHAGSSTQWKT
jgi:TolB protein